VAKFKFHISIGYMNAEHEELFEIADDELEGTPEEREKTIGEYLSDWANNSIEIWHEEVKEEGND
jgi:hypothetical protein